MRQNYAPKVYYDNKDCLHQKLKGTFRHYDSNNYMPLHCDGQ